MAFIENRLEECLNDIGCSKEEKEKILKCYAQHDMQEVIHLLRVHRKAILKAIHTGEKQISCLDYLVFQLEKELKR